MTRMMLASICVFCILASAAIAGLASRPGATLPTSRAFAVRGGQTMYPDSACTGTFDCLGLGLPCDSIDAENCSSNTEDEEFASPGSGWWECDTAATICWINSSQAPCVRSWSCTVNPQTGLCERAGILDQKMASYDCYHE